jgi:hypothetical protein
MPFGQPRNPYSAGFVDLPQQGPLAAAVAPKPKINFLGVLADALAGAAGRQGPYASMLMEQRQQDQQEQAYQHHRSDQFDLWRQEQDYQAAHPQAQPPSGYARELIDMGIQPGTPEFVSRMDAHLKAIDDPVITTQLPGDRIYSGPRSGLGAALGGASNGIPSAPVGPLVPIGGQSGASSAGGFRRRNRAK